MRFTTLYPLMRTHPISNFLASMIPGRLVRVFAAPYIAGDSLEKALSVADRMHQEKGILTTLDVLGESEKTEAKVRGAVDAYLRVLDAVKSRPYCTISIKPGHWGYYVSPDLCRRNIEEMAAACQAAGRGLTVDMEDADVTDWTIQLYRDLKPKYPVLGTVLQSRLYRTEKDLDAFDGLEANIRMVIGIYNVPPPAAMTSKRDIKEALLEQSLTLLKRGHYVCFATHDIDYVRRAWKLFRERGIGKDRYEFQMLLGVPRDKIIKELRDAGETVRLYIPFANDWDDALAYLRRRMLESPSMAALVLKNLAFRNS